MVVDPRVKSLNDMRDGIPNDDQWNLTQPKSANDIKRHKICMIYMGFRTILFTVLIMFYL